MDVEETNFTPDTPEQTSNNRSLLFWILGLVAAFMIGMGSGYLIWARPLEAQLSSIQQESTQAAAAGQQSAQTQAANAGSQQQVKRYAVTVDDDPVRGSNDAPITIIEFSDYECPFCRQWHIEVLPQLEEKYGDQIRLVYRDFPLYGMHANAESAAIAANCAGEQNKYYDYGDLLFINQSSLSSDTYKKLAQDLQLNLDSFDQCVEDTRYKDEVEGDYNFASQLGVRSTPTFFINGLAVVGAQPFSVFEQIIDMELAGQIPK